MMTKRRKRNYTTLNRFEWVSAVSERYITLKKNCIHIYVFYIK